MPDILNDFERKPRRVRLLVLCLVAIIVLPAGGSVAIVFVDVWAGLIFFTAGYAWLLSQVQKL